MARKKIRVIESIWIDRDIVTSLATAKKLVRDMGGTVIKLDETKRFWKFRQHDPSLFRKDSFRTHTYDHGVRTILAYPKASCEAFFRKIQDL